MEAGKTKIESTSPEQHRKRYENLLTYSAKEPQRQRGGGYQDFIDDDSLEEGDSIDLNTQEYRYIGYFTNMRKAIELVWNYPMSAARRGISGKVNVKFTIQKTGTVSKIDIVESSGHKLLDYAIVDAIKLASPFAPLPKGFNRKKLDVTGAFRYVLGN